MEEYTEKCQRLNKEINRLSRDFEMIKPLPALIPLNTQPSVGITSSRFKEILEIKKKIEEKGKELKDYCGKNCKHE
jgi:hypothetical protein